MNAAESWAPSCREKKVVPRETGAKACGRAGRCQGEGCCTMGAAGRAGGTSWTQSRQPSPPIDGNSVRHKSCPQALDPFQQEFLEAIRKPLQAELSHCYSVSA